MKFLIKSESEYKNSTSILRKIGCRLPFKNIEIQNSGEISVCCHAWLSEYTGNILTDSPEEILNNTKRLDILTSMENGEFTYCNDACPYLNSYLTNGVIDKPHALTPIEMLRANVAKDRYVINFSYDRSCNLQCPSCRKGLIFLSPDKTEDPNVIRLLHIHNNVKKLVDYLIDSGEQIQLSITGSGDPFASDIYWGYLKELAQRSLPDTFRIKLMTNGILMTDQYWKEIEPLWKHIQFVGVSIDAATEDTYKKIRKNGNFTKLKANLKYFNLLVATKRFPNLSGWHTHFVLQKDNYKEILDYAKWQLSYVTLGTIYFGLIIHWDHLSAEEYADMTDIDVDLLSNLLSDPIFSNPRITLGNVNAFKNT